MLSNEEIEFKLQKYKDKASHPFKAHACSIITIITQDATIDEVRLRREPYILQRR